MIQVRVDNPSFKSISYLNGATTFSITTLDDERLYAKSRYGECRYGERHGAFQNKKIQNFENFTKIKNYVLTFHSLRVSQKDFFF